MRRNCSTFVSCFWGRLIAVGVVTCGLLLSSNRDALGEDDAGAAEETAKSSDPFASSDPMRELQSQAVREQSAAWGYWGNVPGKYSTWMNHSNRMIPVYTFGITLDSLREEGSVYSDPERLEKLYGLVPKGTVNPTAVYFDQTDVYRLQKKAIELGKRNIILMVFDGMDWQTTRAAAHYQTGDVGYERGRGRGLAFQDERSMPTDFGLVVTSALLSGAKFDVDAQTVISAASKSTGGYDPGRGGESPWHEQPLRDYHMGLDREQPHTVTDSSSSASSLTAGVKTYNGAINVLADGRYAEPIAHWLQREKQYKIGVVTSVPVSHATPGAAYANNVTRNDFQDISRDMVGLPSSSHRRDPLPGVDVLIGAGWGESEKKDTPQGQNYMPGNVYFHQDDMRRSDAENGGRYVVAERTSGESGKEVLAQATRKAIETDQRLLGYFGVKAGHLPFRTADGGFNPTFDAKGTERYSPADLHENPTLADMTDAALEYLERSEHGFWLMVEAGDVDWANHANNIDSSIGAVLSGEAAFARIMDWIKRTHSEESTVVIVTSDHGHYLVLQDPSVIARAGQTVRDAASSPETTQ